MEVSSGQSYAGMGKIRWLLLALLLAKVILG